MSNIKDANRKQMMENFIRNIAHISDEEYQRRVWIEERGPECDDFDESVCLFFDIADPILEKYKDYGITENQYNLLKKFYDNFDEFYTENCWPSEFISTPEWKKIMGMAKEVLKAFNYQKKL